MEKMEFKRMKNEGYDGIEPKNRGEFRAIWESWREKRPFVEEIKPVQKSEPISSQSINFDYDFKSNLEESIIQIKDILKQRNLTCYDALSNNFILAESKQYNKNILIFVTKQKFNKIIEVSFSELHYFLNNFKWFCENDHGEEILDGAFTECGWESKKIRKIRQNALKRRAIIQGPNRVIKALNWHKTTPTINPSIIKEDLVWIKQNKEYFMELEQLLLFHAKNIIAKASHKNSSISNISPLGNEPIIDLAFVLNISKS